MQRLSNRFFVPFCLVCLLDDVSVFLVVPARLPIGKEMFGVSGRAYDEQTNDFEPAWNVSVCAVPAA